jgi:hypothetical protein
VTSWRAPSPVARHDVRRGVRASVLLALLLPLLLAAGLSAAFLMSGSAEEGDPSDGGHASTIGDGSDTAPAIRHDPGRTTVRTEPAPVAPLAPLAVPRGEPARILIPAIAVDARLVPLGLEPDRAMEVPAFGSAGWYSKGPRPGHPGPAVIVAHVDSVAGPDVFAQLRHLVAGDRVDVVYDGGDSMSFIVTASQQARKDQLPVGSIWPVTHERLLTLITCGGPFDRTTGHYRDNVIVHAVAASAATLRSGPQ